MSTIATTNLQPSMEHAAGEAPTVEHRIDATEAFKRVRRAALRLSRFAQLPHPDAEDLALDIITRELAEAQSVGRPNMVRKDRTNAAYVQLEARSYRRRIITRRLESQTADGELPDMEDEDISEREADEAPPLSPLGALSAGRRLARMLDLPDTGGVAETLAQGLWEGDASELADALGVKRDQWRKLASRGAAIVRDAYPDPIMLVDAIDRGVVVRRTPLERRTLGAELPPKDRHRSPAQSAREANVLIARDTRPGCKPSTASMIDRGARTKAPINDHVTKWTTDLFIPQTLLRDIGRALKTWTEDAPRSGARPIPAAHGIPAEHSGMLPTPEPKLRFTGRAAIDRGDTAARRRTSEAVNRPDAPLSRRRLTAVRRMNADAYRRDEREAKTELQRMRALVDRARGM